MLTNLERITLTVILSVVAVSVVNAKEAADASLAQANNPLANMKALNFQNYYMPNLYEVPDESANTFWIRYAQPVDKWLIRASLPINTIPTATGTESGVGDFNVFAAYLLSDSTAPRQYGIGPLLAAPTAEDETLGTEKWQAGFAAVLFDASSPLVQWGGLVTWQTSFAGDDDRDDTNLAAVQPFLFFQLGQGKYLRSAPIWVFDLEQDTHLMPFGLGIGQVVKVGKTVFNIFIEPQFTFLHDGAGQPEIQVLTGLNMQFLN